MPVDVPHFNYPFGFGGKFHADVVEQDSIDDVSNCVIVALITEVGSRVETPTFGTPSQIFEIQPLNLEVLVNAVEEWESRASMVMSQEIDSRDQLVAKINNVITLRRGASA